FSFAYEGTPKGPVFLILRAQPSGRTSPAKAQDPQGPPPLLQRLLPAPAAGLRALRQADGGPHGAGRQPRQARPLPALLLLGVGDILDTFNIIGYTSLVASLVPTKEVCRESPHLSPGSGVLLPAVQRPEAGRRRFPPSPDRPSGRLAEAQPPRPA